MKRNLFDTNFQVFKRKLVKNKNNIYSTKIMLIKNSCELIFPICANRTFLIITMKYLQSFIIFVAVLSLLSFQKE